MLYLGCSFPNEAPADRWSFYHNICVKNEPTNENWLDGMDDQELLAECLRACEAGSFIREKHDPDEFHEGRTEKTFRTVVSDDAKASLRDDLMGSRYEVEFFHDARYNSQIAVLYPNVTSILSVAGSGIQAYDNEATSVQDALVVALDTMGPHVFAEHKSQLTSAQYNGKPRFTRIHRSQKR